VRRCCGAYGLSASQEASPIEGRQRRNLMIRLQASSGVASAVNVGSTDDARRRLLIVALLAVSLTVGCSKDSPPPVADPAQGSPSIGVVVTQDQGQGSATITLASFSGSTGHLHVRYACEGGRIAVTLPTSPVQSASGPCSTGAVYGDDMTVEGVTSETIRIAAASAVRWRIDVWAEP
jgi:hypothetical protein